MIRLTVRRTSMALWLYIILYHDIGTCTLAHALIELDREWAYRERENQREGREAVPPTIWIVRSTL